MKTNYKLKHNIELAITKKFNQTNKSKATARLAPPQCLHGMCHPQCHVVLLSETQKC